MKYYSAALLIQVKNHLKSGGIIAYPTEFCFGLGCDPFNRQALDKLIKIKSRSKDKGLIIVASRFSQLERLINPIDDQISLGEYWPGPYTLLLDIKKSNYPLSLLFPLTGRHNKIAVRITKHKLVRQLCSFLQQPLVSTSANKTNFVPIKTYLDCKNVFGNEVLVLPGIIDHHKYPSTIIDWSSKKRLR